MMLTCTWVDWKTDLFTVHISIYNYIIDWISFINDIFLIWKGGPFSAMDGCFFFYCPAVGRQGGVITVISKDFVDLSFRGVEMLMACYKFIDFLW